MTDRVLLSRLAAAAAALSLAESALADEAACKRLLSATNESFAVLTAEVVDGSEQLPAHCRVHGHILPNINFELRLPEDWNGRFYMVGNGGYLGEFFDQSYGLARGYATASTDTGHQGASPTFAHDNRPAEIDFAFRAVHLTAKAAKALIAARYDRPPAYSYFRGCSTGGRQALMEAQRFPDDFDGWSVGAPIYDYTYKQTYNASWVAQALFGGDGAGHVPVEKLETLGRAVYARCDALDGLEDGLIDDPRECDFDARRDLLQCDAGEDRADCFTAPQIEAIEKIYAGPGQDVYPGAVPGGEWMPHEPGARYGGWETYFTGIAAGGDESERARNPYGGDAFEPVQLRNGTSFFKYLAFEQDRPAFDMLTDLDFEDVPDTSFMAALMNAMDPDLTDVHAAGKKILMWHGWADVGLNPLRSIDYLERVQQTMGVEKTDEFMRLFMVPGMYHCDGGPGPDVFDDLTALERWVEDDVAPERIIAYQVDTPDGYGAPWGNVVAGHATAERSRPLCSYPQVARYDGSGSTDDADNFQCTAP